MQPTTGARLAYVVVAQEGTVRRPVHKYDKKGGKGLVTSEAEEPAGYLVYFPRGHVIRLKDKKALMHYGLDRDAPIINMQGLQDPNSPLGKMLLSQDDAVRRKGYADLEKQVMQLAQAKSGRITLIRDLKELEADADEEEVEAA